MVSFYRQIPNILTASRGVMALIITALFYSQINSRFVVIIVLFVLATLTDWFDGKIARKFNYVSNLGKILDSMLDKVLVLAMFMLLIPFQLLPSWIYVLLLMREISIDSLKNYFASQGIISSARMSGRIKMALETILITICLVRLISENTALTQLSYVTAGLTLFFAFYSAGQYIYSWTRIKSNDR